MSVEAIWISALSILFVLTWISIALKGDSMDVEWVKQRISGLDTRLTKLDGHDMAPSSANPWRGRLSGVYDVVSASEILLNTQVYLRTYADGTAGVASIYEKATNPADETYAMKITVGALLDALLAQHHVFITKAKHDSFTLAPTKAAY